jgi:hypothetical protein
MVEGYEWVFIICIASLAFGGLTVAYEVYLTVKARRGRRAELRHRRPGPPRRA